MRVGMRLLLTRRSILDCCSFGYSKDRRRTHWSLEMKTESYYTVSSWIHLMHSIIMDTHTAQYHHGYTYCTVSSWIHILHSIVMDTHTAQHCHGHEHSCTIVSWWNLLPDHSCWIAGNGTTLRGRLGAGTVFTPGKEVEYKRLMAVLTCDLVNTSQTLRTTTSRGVLLLFPGHSQILSCSFSTAAR